MSTTSASTQIDKIISKHGGWKGELISRLRTIMREADSHITEDVKWKMPTRPEGLPVWDSNGMICFVEIWNDNVKLIFTKGADIADKDKLFNSRLKSSTVRAIEFHEDDKVDEAGVKALVRAAVKLHADKA